MITAEALKGMHTRKLLAALRSSCVDDQQLERWANDGGRVPSREEYEASVTVGPAAFGLDENVGSTITISQLKAELSQRPHVPNKQEARRIRQERARKGSR